MQQRYPTKTSQNLGARNQAPVHRHRNYQDFRISEELRFSVQISPRLLNVANKATNVVLLFLVGVLVGAAANDQPNVKKYDQAIVDAGLKMALTQMGKNND